MDQQIRELEEIMRFQQSLLRLVVHGSEEDAKSKVAEPEQAQQLEVWVRKMNTRPN
ncbi:hypothetical protein [uncultured Paludibaculum sp.]|uniref:hypothetical protein n=1 Tax=uncultured Paludibaculum sp. TaxID=1765020 RepID=UPI002AABC0C9|nr:hypothetical protein [uncultured Paludibaculum sp.]